MMAKVTGKNNKQMKKMFTKKTPKMVNDNDADDMSMKGMGKGKVMKKR